MTNSLLVLLSIPLFFSPKINLVSFAGETAGIRIDDLVLGLISVIIILRKLMKERLTLDSIERPMLAILALMLVSNIFNTIIYKNSSVLYTVRIFEYFLFYYIGQYAYQRISIVKLTWSLLAVNGVVMVAQYLRLIGGFASAGYTSELDRMIGITGGPWEIGTLLNFFFCVLAFDGKYDKSKIFLVFMITFLMIVITKARQPLVIHVFLYFSYLARRYRSTSLKISIAGIFLMLAVGAFIVFPDNPIVERSTGLFTSQNLEAIADQFDSASVDIASFDGFDELDSSNSDVDLSWTYRLYKWSVILIAFANYPTSWVFGFGPGAWGTAVDGGWIRIVTETGVVGLVLFVMINRRSALVNIVMKYMIIAYLLNLVMIDVEIAYKVQQFLFFSMGYYFRQRSVDARVSEISSASFAR